MARELQAYAKYLQPWHQEKFEQTEKGSKAFAYHQFFLQVAQATDTLPVARELQAYAKYLQPWHQEKFEQTEKGSKAFAYHQFFLQVAQATDTKVLLRLCNHVKYQR